MTSPPSDHLPSTIVADDGSIPFWLDVEDVRVFAWYHPAKGDAHNNQAIVLCNTFGSEAMLLHPAYRQLAIELSAQGYPCLRFDYPGTNDSEGSPRDAHLLDLWLKSIHCAIDFLRNESGVEHISLFGVLLGATLAAHAATQRNDIEDLILWAPYISGKNFLRTIKLQNSVITANEDNIIPNTWRDGDSEAFGFLLPKDFAEALSKINLSKITVAPCKQAFVFVRDSSSNEKKLTKILTEQGVDLTFQDSAIEDLSHIMARMQIPTALNQNILSWLNAKAPLSLASPKPSTSPSSHLSQKYNTDQYTEEAVFINNNVNLFGIVNRPNTSTSNDTGILLINGGSNHRAGINRNYTEWARAWASQGYTVLRIDICGLGDSPPQNNQERNTLYLDSTRQDIEKSCEYLKEILRVKKLVVAGLCAGAYQSLRVALTSNSIEGVLLINPLRFQKPKRHQDGRNTHNSVEQLVETTSFLAFMLFFLNYKNWRTLKKWKRTSLSLAKSACVQLLKQMRDLLQPKKWSALNNYNVAAKEILFLTDRKVHVFILCGTKEVILPFFKVALARYRSKLNKTPYFAMEELDNTNHILSPIWSQHKAYERLTEQLKIISDRDK